MAFLAFQRFSAFLSERFKTWRVQYGLLLRFQRGDREKTCVESRAPSSLVEVEHVCEDVGRYSCCLTLDRDWLRRLSSANWAFRRSCDTQPEPPPLPVAAVNVLVPPALPPNSVDGSDLSDATRSQIVVRGGFGRVAKRFPLTRNGGPTQPTSRILWGPLRGETLRTRPSWGRKHRQLWLPGSPIADGRNLSSIPHGYRYRSSTVSVTMVPGQD